jgi:hypothetical protein
MLPVQHGYLIYHLSLPLSLSESASALHGGMSHSSEWRSGNSTPEKFSDETYDCSYIPHILKKKVYYTGPACIPQNVATDYPLELIKSLIISYAWPMIIWSHRKERVLFVIF